MRLTREKGVGDGNNNDEAASAPQTREDGRDRSGFGQGGDRSGRADAASGLLTCAVYEPNCVGDCHNCSKNSGTASVYMGGHPPRQT